MKNDLFTNVELLFEFLQNEYTFVTYIGWKGNVIKFMEQYPKYNRYAYILQIDINEYERNKNKGIIVQHFFGPKTQEIIIKNCQKFKLFPTVLSPNHIRLIN